MMLYLLSITPMRKLPGSSLSIKGQTLIGILVAMAIFSILAHAIFLIVGSSYQLVSYNRARITARHLAQEKIELIRNLPYDNAGTSGGIPGGPLLQEENIVRNKLNFLIKTTIIYYDDPFDYTAPSDLLPTDYKRIRVEISWGGIAPSRNNPVVMISDIAPRGVETTAGGGTLSIVVFNANGDPVPQADVLIAASSATPAVNLSLKTADNGRIILPGAPACFSCYEITVTKPLYSTDRTYSTSEVTNPNKPHQTVIESELTEISFSIDKVSTLNISSHYDRENNFSPFPNFTFQLKGDKTIGTDSDSNPVYKFDQTLITNASGDLTLENMEWDSYRILLPEASLYVISGTNPLQPISLLADTTLNFSFALANQTTNTLLLTFLDTSDNPIASATAILSNGGFEQSKFSGEVPDPDFGQAFFSGLAEQTYTLEATKSGFIDFNGSIPVSGQTEEEITLTP